MRVLCSFAFLMIASNSLFTISCEKHIVTTQPIIIKINQCKISPSQDPLNVTQGELIQWKSFDHDGTNYIITFKNNRSPIQSPTSSTTAAAQNVTKDAPCINNKLCDYPYSLTVDKNPPPPPCADPVIHIKN